MACSLTSPCGGVLYVDVAARAVVNPRVLALRCLNAHTFYVYRCPARLNGCGHRGCELCGGLGWLRREQYLSLLLARPLPRERRRSCQVHEMPVPCAVCAAPMASVRNGIARPRVCVCGCGRRLPVKSWRRYATPVCKVKIERQHRRRRRAQAAEEAAAWA